VVGNLLLVLGALPLLALALSRSVPLICVANALSGFGLVSLNGLWTPTIQVLIPENVRSRVNSYDWLVSLVIMPVGFAVAGPLGASIGFTSTLVAAAIVLSVPCALVVLVPGIRGVHRTASGDDDAGTQKADSRDDLGGDPRWIEHNGLHGEHVAETVLAHQENQGRCSSDDGLGP